MQLIFFLFIRLASIHERFKYTLVDVYKHLTIDGKYEFLLVIMITRDDFILFSASVLVVKVLFQSIFKMIRI